MGNVQSRGGHDIGSGGKMSGIKRARQTLYSIFSPEIEAVRRFLDLYPLLTMGIMLLIGVILGGILSAWPSQFVVLALLGGFGLAIAHGSIIGLPSYLSVALVVPILAFATYASLRVLRSVEQYSRTAPHLMRLKRKYLPVSNYLLAHAGAIGITGVLAFSTFLIGWWVTVMIAYLLEVNVSTTMKGTGVGLVLGAFIFWASYQGLLRWIPNPIIITAITLIVFSVLARIILYKAERASQNTSRICDRVN
jgi:MFS family permease